MALIPALWGPRLISRDHRMHVYSDPRDQCSLNTQKLNNKSYIHTYRLTQIMTIMVKSYIDKALRAEHQMKHKQRKSSSISRTHATCLNPTGILTGKRPSSHARLQRTLL